MGIKLFTQKKRSSAVILIKEKAIKLFFGKNRKLQFQREITGYKQAKNCPIWSKNIVDQKQIYNTSILASSRGRPVSRHELILLNKYLNEIFNKLEENADVRPTTEIINMNNLRKIVGDDCFESVNYSFGSILESLYIPCCSQHGDIHRGNVVWVNGNLKVIDLDRFKSQGSSIFDRIHFTLSEKQRGTERRWLPFALNNLELVGNAISDSKFKNLPLKSVLVAYCFDRIEKEGNAAMLSNYISNKYKAQALTLIDSHLNNG